MPEDNSSHLFDSEPQPIPPLDIDTIHETRRRLFGMIFARQVEIMQPEGPIYSPADMTEEELIAAVRNQEDARKEHKSKRDKRRGEIDTFWKVSALLDELENDAMKQQEQE